MKASDLMTPNVVCCGPSHTIREAAQEMESHDCGCLPVLDDGGRVIGTVTDRDIAVRAVALGKSPETPVADVMSPDPTCCSPDTDVEQVERVMEERQVRRVPIVDGDRRCVGIVSQADLAERSDADVAQVIRDVSRPSPAPRAEGRSGERSS